MSTNFKYTLFAICLLTFFSQDAMTQNNHKESIEEKTQQWQGISIKTNAIYIASLAPNISIDFYPFSPLWSIEATAITPWWSSDKKQKRYRLQEYKLKYVYHFNQKSRHHLSIGVIGGLYDLKFSSMGFKGDFIGGELGYEYSIFRKKHFSINLGFGLGFIDTTYDKYYYNNYNELYIYKSSENTKYWGPTSLSLSFVWNYSL